MTVQNVQREERVDTLYQRIRRLLDVGEARKAQIILQALFPVDQADIFRELSDEKQLRLLEGLPVEAIADILEKVEDEEVAQIAEQLSQDQLADILDEMEPDEAADLLGDLEPDRVVNLLALMADKEEIRPLLLHPDETAGGLMTSEYLALGRNMWAEKALQAIRAWAPERDLHYYFVVDTVGRVEGIISLLQLIKAKPRTELQQIMSREFVSAPAGADQEACARLMSRYDLTALPVVDEQQRLIGVITIDDVVDVLEDEATEDIQRFGGAAPLEKSYLRTSIWEIARSRGGWLLLFFFTGLITTRVLEHFEATLQEVVALSFFIPLLIGTGGNAGSQTTATVTRALAVGDIDRKDTLKVLWHEVRVGLLMGLLVALAGFMRAWLMGGDIGLGQTIGLAVGAIVFWSTTIGSLLPIFASLMGVDPALVSGPLMHTLVDATGLFIYLTVAQWILGL